MSDKGIERHILSDWNKLVNLSAPDMELDVSIMPDRIDIEVATDEDGAKRSVWIEQEQGVLRVHIYDSLNDEPVTATIAPGEKMVITGEAT